MSSSEVKEGEQLQPEEQLRFIRTPLSNVTFAQSEQLKTGCWLRECLPEQLMMSLVVHSAASLHFCFIRTDYSCSYFYKDKVMN